MKKKLTLVSQVSWSNVVIPENLDVVRVPDKLKKNMTEWESSNLLRVSAICCTCSDQV